MSMCGAVCPLGARPACPLHARSCCMLVFDLLLLNGRDLTREPQHVRRAALEREMVAQPRRVELSPAVLLRGSGSTALLAAAFGEAARRRLEGLMVKGADAPYTPEDRKAWMKIKKDYLDEAQVRVRWKHRPR
eukprot:912957-Prymnesium_polylepis.2